MKDKMVYKWNNVVGALMNVPISVGTFSVVTDFAVLENMKDYRDKGMDDGKGKGKGKDKSYIFKPKNPKPSIKERPAKDDACHHCKEVGHWKRNCPVCLVDLIKKKKKQVGTASSSGTLVDVFIAKHKNKLGQSFGFCRFIKVTNPDALILSLNQIRIGKLRLHANLAWFDRNSGGKQPIASPKVLLTKKANVHFDSSSNHVSSYPCIIHPLDAPIDLPSALLACFKDIRSIGNIRTLCKMEGFIDVEFKYLGGLWVLSIDERLIWIDVEGIPIRAWNNGTFSKICERWGEVIFMDDSDKCNRLSKRICIKSSHTSLVFASITVSINNVSYAIRVRELCSWTPSFIGQEFSSEGLSSNGLSDKEDDSLSGTNGVDLGADIHGGSQSDGEVHYSDENQVDNNNNSSPSPSVVPNSFQSIPGGSDPFELEPLINRKPHKVSFGDQPLSESVNNLSGKESIRQPGFSIVDRLEETIKVGLAMGLNMDGCETTLASLIANIGDTIWGNSQFDFATSSARGLSGGIISIWNNLVFSKSNIMCNDNYVVVDGFWIPGDVNIRWINVYAPQNLSSKLVLWSTLLNLIATWDGVVVMMGDFNEVRDASERHGSSFNDRQVKFFNDFIQDASLIDVTLGGYNYTWTDKWGSKMSKLDRFLVSDNFFDHFPCATGIVLEKGTPDHRPILLKELQVDYGPSPFRFFHSWLEMEGFKEFVADTWNSDGIIHECAMILFKKKLQNLKKAIRIWIGKKRSDDAALKKSHLDLLSVIDIKIDRGTARAEDLNSRTESVKILGDLDRLEAKDLAQKAKVKWALEGDENSSFFHSSLKKKRRQLAIKGILKDGEWIEDPGPVKSVFLAHFKNRFQPSPGTAPILDTDFLNPISQSQRDFLERPFSREDIKQAVWECGGDRAPGPDGFTFKFYTFFWDLIQDDVVRFVHEFFRSNIFPKGCNSSFIALIPKKYSGWPSHSKWEILSWHRHHKKEVMVFKVDFEKAFDSLRWDFLDLILDKIGFGSRWRAWINGFDLLFGPTSVLVNGSPTEEFEIFRGLRQGDPLSPFLFILAMEGLHAYTCKAEALGLFKGVHFGSDNLCISHLMYADDVIFMGEWTWSNARNLISLLRCFYLVSGLRINIHKSTVLGIGIVEEEVSYMANIIGCGASKFPLKYLGIPVGCNMSRCSNWNVIIQKFSSKLSAWKARLLSVGGRLSLIRSVLSSLPTYFMSIYLTPVAIRKKLESLRNKFFIGGDICERKMTWVKWDQCLASKKEGGLGIGSIYGLNIGLLFKWVWRFLCNHSDLWIRVIKCIHGATGGINNASNSNIKNSTWNSIIAAINGLKAKGIDLVSYCSRKIGNGADSSFWYDTWCGNQSLKVMFPRIYNLETVKDCSIASRLNLQDLTSVLRRHPRGGVESVQFDGLKAAIGNITLSEHRDSWYWSLGGTNGFSVASIHSLVDSHILNAGNEATHWNISLPIKVNVFL
ncbi:RNA-directed DNA polymerase, eukaryota [Tanacetum coccineum]